VFGEKIKQTIISACSVFNSRNLVDPPPLFKIYSLAISQVLPYPTSLSIYFKYIKKLYFGCLSASP
jgi:hypothetical protein